MGIEDKVDHCMKRTEEPGTVPNRQTSSFLQKEISTHSQITNSFKKHFLFPPFFIQSKGNHFQIQKVFEDKIVFQNTKYKIDNRTFIIQKCWEKFCTKLDAKSDINEIKLMVTDHVDGNRILSALYITVPLHCY